MASYPSLVLVLASINGKAAMMMNETRPPTIATAVIGTVPGGRPTTKSVPNGWTAANIMLRARFRLKAPLITMNSKPVQTNAPKKMAFVEC
jgi:hypothetical protein